MPHFGSTGNGPAGESKRQEPAPTSCKKYVLPIFHRRCLKVSRRSMVASCSISIRAYSRSERFFDTASRWISMRKSAKGDVPPAAIGASQFGNVLMVSEGGQLSFYPKGHFIWTL